MFETVELPIWIVVLGGIALASLTLNAVLLPSVRWFFRGRVNRLLSRANERLRLSLKPFALTKRQVLVDRLTYDPVVIEAVAQEARETGVPREVVAERAARYAKEIVPSFSAAAYFLFGVRLSRWIAQTLYRVRLGASEDRALEGIDPEATVVFVMNHRSNVDYLLVTYLASERTSLSYAAGEWARVWPLEQIAKAMGAFFIRRKSENPLYRKVLARYVQMATEGGVTQAIFPEGGLSRDGSLRPPKLGLLSYMLETFDPDGERDVVFVPVGLNYDRVLEDRILVGHEVDEKGRPRFRASIWVGIGFFLKHIWLRIIGRWHKFGYASVSFGAPISLKALVTDEANARDLGRVLIRAVGAVIPVLPVPLIATVMAEAEGSLTRDEVVSRATALRDELVGRGAHFHVARSDFDYTVEVGLRALVRRRILKLDGDSYSVNSEQVALLSYYANAIAHLPRGE
ncbi:1-acyl-sn-glycerol-3-phosphate acyltransferase [Pontivivens insulae]|uniref:Glycerol-3-phosphate acyltransferase n=1 Tax=Pontivivens insulae TaxID=1639689 RepID=A0A2R8A782_9RHOB|nr:1-acyl-sn-glycerol-3-phosphate acyltransferase [Pontivivens insulae]RED18201.1 glycerol-3-phosphate acyltransferase [Pontivivens insulae]SPF28099.1 Glycerol-3-phosphate acyltransferase [Pontivivens insulae]